MRFKFIPTIIALSCMGVPASPADCAVVTPPTGYIGFRHDFKSTAGSTALPNDFYNIDVPLVFGAPLANHHGTFWSHQFAFTNSSAGLPPNHGGGDQGGYFGLQVAPDGSQIAIFSIWWAEATQAAPGATCKSGIEMWYGDGAPWVPPITDVSKTDPQRPVAGGPFQGCRLPVTLTPGQRYRLRIWRTGEANKPGPKWWGAWLINDDTKEERQVGQIAVHHGWGGLSVDTSGFMEQFGPMPDGCRSIPASATMMFPATADDGKYTAKFSAYVYGPCKNEVTARYRATPANGGIS